MDRPTMSKATTGFAGQKFLWERLSLKGYNSAYDGNPQLAMDFHSHSIWGCHSYAKPQTNLACVAANAKRHNSARHSVTGNFTF
jgi:hypothetical protein